MLNQTAWLR